MAAESFDAVLAEGLEVVAWRNSVGSGWFYCELDPREVHDNGKQTDALILASDHKAFIDRLQSAHARELAEQQATIKALQLDNVNLRKGWQHQVSAVNSWADRCIEQEDRAVAAEARADAAMGLLRKARSRVADISQLGVEIDAFLAQQALAGGER